MYAFTSHGTNPSPPLLRAPFVCLRRDARYPCATKPSHPCARRSPESVDDPQHADVACAWPMSMKHVSRSCGAASRLLIPTCVCPSYKNTTSQISLPAAKAGSNSSRPSSSPALLSALMLATCLRWLGAAISLAVQSSEERSHGSGRARRWSTSRQHESVFVGLALKLWNMCISPTAMYFDATFFKTMAELDLSYSNASNICAIVAASRGLHSSRLFLRSIRTWRPV